jgi:bla regulator protein BlaR1
MIPAAFAPLANHVWQSTLFAAVVGLLTLALQRNQARVRYWLWLVASYKFLIPFSLLVSIGHQFEWRSVLRFFPFPVFLFPHAVSGPLFLTSLPAATRPVPDQMPVLPIMISALWACGFLVVVVRWLREWVRIRAVVRAASPLRLGLPIQIVTTSAHLEPGVFGIFRPVLLLPEGIAGRLTQAQLQAVFAHELCHVRRRDNLAAAIHMLVEALFWFYPLVWWLGARMVDEREHACDEDVLQTGSQAQAYAESILKVCELYLESPLTCISGVTGSDLKKRIQRITKNHFGIALSSRKKFLLATAGVVALAVPVIAGALTAPRPQAQAPATQLALAPPASNRPAFEVASIKLNKSSDPPHSNIALGPGDFMRPVGGLFSASNHPLAAYITFAYKLGGNMQYLMPGLPSWVISEHFDIEARAEGSPKKDEFRLMMQSLLADRFKLTIHHETREVPVFALVLSKAGKTGPQLFPHTDDATCASMTQFQQYQNESGVAPSIDPKVMLPALPCNVISNLQPTAPGRIRLGGRKVPLQLIASSFSGYDNFNRPIVDRTGLTGTFDFWLEFTPPANGAPPGFQPDATGPSSQEALQEQLGLKLESQKAPLDVMVVDHIEQSSEN